MNSIKYSIVIPCYNSASMLDELTSRVFKVMALYESFEIILVDDCSPDKSWEVIQTICEKDPRVIGVQLMKNSGQGSATLAGMRIAGGSFIITMDDDLQHPPEDIPILVNAIMEDQNCDVIIGCPKEKKHGITRRLGSNLINNVNSLFLQKDKRLRFTGFRALTNQVGKELTNILTPYPALGPMIYSITHRVKNVPFNHAPRKVDESNYDIRRIVKQTLGNFIGYSMLPLRLLAIIGGIGTFCSVFIGLYFIYRYFVVGITVPGWTSLVLVLISISGFIFFAFGIIGEYILRITMIASSTPQSFVRRHINKKA